MTRGASKESHRGLTMIEVLVSMSVASIALAVAPTTLRITGRAIIQARDGTTAIGLAQAKLEELIAQTDVRADGEDVLAPPFTPTAFTRTWHVEPIHPREELHRLFATVRWDDGTHQVTLETCTWGPEGSRQE